MPNRPDPHSRPVSGAATRDKTGRIEVALGVLTRRRAGRVEVLIAQRAATAVLGGCWEFPGGKVEAGETYASALCREMHEELGVEVRVGACLCEVEHDYDHGRVALRLFGCERVTGEARALAAARLAWVEAGALGDYAFPEANGPIVAAAAHAAGLASDAPGAREE